MDGDAILPCPAGRCERAGSTRRALSLNEDTCRGQRKIDLV
jgi:hypothetical protein